MLRLSIDSKLISAEIEFTFNNQSKIIVKAYRESFLKPLHLNKYSYVSIEQLECGQDIKVMILSKTNQDVPSWVLFSNNIFEMQVMSKTYSKEIVTLTAMSKDKIRKIDKFYSE